MRSRTDIVRSGARAVVMGAWTAGLMPVAQVHERLTDEHARAARAQRYVQRWAAGLLTVFGIEVGVVGAPAPPAERARLVVANHRSPVDILLLLRHFGGCVLSRADLERWPILGPAARHGGTIFVDRDDHGSGVKAIREIRRRLAAGRTVIVFPEGTTHRGDEVRPFLGGAFAAVRGLDAELLPVGLAYEPGSEFVDETFLEHIGRVAARPRTRMALCAGDVRPAVGTRSAISDTMHADVQGLVHRARSALG